MAEQIVPGDGVVAGHGRVDGRLVYAFAQDFTVFGGSLSETNAAKIVQDHGPGDEDGRAGRRPERLGRRAHPGRRALARRLRRHLPPQHARLRRVPQISAIMGPCAGGAVYSPAITDFTIMVEGTSYMFVTGPDVIRTVTHEEVTKEELGGAMTHNEKSGVAHFAVPDDRECLAADPRAARRSCRATTSTTRRAARRRIRPIAQDEALDRLVPESPNQPYDMLDLIHAVVDDGGVPRGARALRAEHHRRLRAARRPPRRHRREPAGAPRRHARHRRVGEGGALRAVLRRVQHPARHVRGRARASCPARGRSTAASSATARSCCTRSPRRPCRR